MRARRDEAAATAATGPGRGYLDRIRTFAEETASAGEGHPFLAHVVGNLEQGSTVLDIGAGAGRFALPLAARGHRVVVVEPNPVLLAVLRRGARQRGVASRLACHQALWEDAGDLAADVVVCADVLPTVELIAPFVARLHRAAGRSVHALLPSPPPTGADLAAVVAEATDATAHVVPLAGDGTTGAIVSWRSGSGPAPRRVASAPGG